MSKKMTYSERLINRGRQLLELTRRHEQREVLEARRVKSDMERMSALSPTRRPGKKHASPTGTNMGTTTGSEDVVRARINYLESVVWDLFHQDEELNGMLSAIPTREAAALRAVDSLLAAARREVADVGTLAPSERRERRARAMGLCNHARDEIARRYPELSF